jgi:hypothetical protein
MKAIFENFSRNQSPDPLEDLAKTPAVFEFPIIKFNFSILVKKTIFF